MIGRGSCLPLLLLAASLSCRSESSSAPELPPPPNGTRKVKVTFDEDGNPVIAGSVRPPAMPRISASSGAAPPDRGGSLSCETPQGWKRLKPSSSMRYAQYSVDRAQGDTSDAELVVFFFGSSGAGNVEETFERWIAAFDAEARSRAKRSVRRIGLQDVPHIEVAGAFDSTKSMVAPQGTEAGTTKESALRGAILQTQEGPYYFKLTGPAVTLAAARTAFDRLLDSCKTLGPATPASSSNDR